MRRSTRYSLIGLEPEESRPAVGSFSTRFSLPSFVKQVERLTDCQRAAIERTGFGNLLRIPKFMLSKNLLIELMDKWSCEERAFMLLHGAIKISLMDVALILGLRVVGDPIILKDNEHFSDLERDYGADKGKITVASLESRLDSLSGEDNEDFVRTFLLYTFGILLFPNVSGKVDSRYLSFLENLDDTGRFAWGAAVLEDILMWLDRRKQTNMQSLGGCLIFLQIWSYEHIDIGRPALVDSYTTFPRVCRWENNRSHQRQWFAAKFNELHEYQITWELQPTSSELEFMVIKELLGDKEGCKEDSCSALINSASSCSKSDIDNSETDSELKNISETQGSRGQEVLLEQQLSSEYVPEVQSEAIRYPSTSSTPELHTENTEPSSECLQTWTNVIGVNFEGGQTEAVETINERQGSRGHEVPLEPLISLSDSVPDVQTEAVGDVSTSSTIESHKEPFAPSSKCQRNLMNAASDNADDLRRRNQLLEKENMELRKEIENLRMENMQLRTLFLSTNDLVVRLETIVMDEAEQAEL